MAAVAAAAGALSGCQDKKPEPVPGPQSLLSAGRACDQQQPLAPLSLKPLFLKPRVDEPGRLLQSPSVGPVAQRLVQGTHRSGAFAWKHAKWTG